MVTFDSFADPSSYAQYGGIDFVRFGIGEGRMLWGSHNNDAGVARLFVAGSRPAVAGRERDLP
ncbi:hypothetical protein SAMN04489806_1893 [Paramicrobacterium humi]|uniref:Uncharacterized protein n=1 Tax=Paramicrobacterium humi TaxID=640635 RepID=A0A1H4MJ78_9MICO|nr:hypothetical protein [Microbacterium humi]SEB83160.1 hypothetical protein SAMN04489806_1893 [Microbacterium humi]